MMTKNGDQIWDWCDRDVADQDQAGGATKAPAQDHFPSELMQVTVTRRGVTFGLSGNFRITSSVNTVTGRKEVTWPDPARIARLLSPGTQFVNAVLSPDQSRAITLEDGPGSPPGARVKHLQLWDTTMRRRVGRPLELTGSLTYLAFSPDSRFAVWTTQTPPVWYLCNARTGELVNRPFDHDGPVLCAAVSPDGAVVITCSTDKTARLWRTTTGQAVGERLVHGREVIHAAFSPSGNIVATTSLDGVVRLWDVTDGTSLGVLEQKNGAWDIAFHPTNGSLLVVNGDKLRVWDVVSRQEVSPAVQGDGEAAVGPGVRYSFSKDGRSVVGLGPLSTWLDVMPDNRPAADLVKLGRLYSGRLLDAKGGDAALGRQELQALWRELRKKYPAEFVVSPKAALEWRIGQLASVAMERPAELAFHRRWLVAELAEAGWQLGERGNEDLGRDNYLQRLYALAQYGHSADAFAAADALAARWSKDADTLYNCARVHALAAGVAKGDAALSDRYAARAMTLLRQAADAGYKDGQRVLKDPDLDALRRRKDFLDFLWDLADTR
jgi:hypothetical protein